MRVDRITHGAMRVLYDAVARAMCGEVERNWGHRLALDWMVQQGIAQPWQAASFWENLAPQLQKIDFEKSVTIPQLTQLHGCLTNWSYRLGLKPLDPIQMAQRARPYAPDLEFDCGTQQLPCMCNRYTPGERELIENHFAARPLRAFNAGPAVVHPRDPGYVVREVDGTRVLDQMTWGFPVYLRGKSGQPLKPKAVNNARFDKLGGFWNRYAMNPANRCLIPTAAFAEAVGPPGSMTTTWLSVKEAPMFAWAGLWRESDEWGACYTGIMTDNAPELAAIHDRSPVILESQDWDTWLHAPLDELSRFDRPYPADRMKVTRTNVLWKVGGEQPPTIAVSS